MNIRQGDDASQSSDACAERARARFAVELPARSESRGLPGAAAARHRAVAAAAAASDNSGVKLELSRRVSDLQ
jgi:hypothetical protein